MRGRFLQGNCNRMKIFEEDSCFWREFHEWLMTPWWFRRRSTHRKRKSNAECTFPKEIIGISCFSQPPTGHAKHNENIRETNDFRDARTISSRKLQSDEDFRRGIMFLERIPWMIDDSVMIRKKIHASEEEIQRRMYFFQRNHWYFFSFRSPPQGM